MGRLTVCNKLFNWVIGQHTSCVVVVCQFNVPQIVRRNMMVSMNNSKGLINISSSYQCFTSVMHQLVYMFGLEMGGEPECLWSGCLGYMLHNTIHWLG